MLYLLAFNGLIYLTYRVAVFNSSAFEEVIK